MEIRNRIKNISNLPIKTFSILKIFMQITIVLKSFYRIFKKLSTCWLYRWSSKI